MERDDSLLARSPGADADAVQNALISQESSIGTAASGRKRRRRRAVASPRSTSGAASAFEHRVARIFLADLLTETGSDWFPSGRIVGVAFQQVVHGVVIDDIVIEYELAGDREVFDLDVKSGLDFIPSDEDYLDVLDGCLDRYSNLANRPGIYGFATKNDNRTAKLSALQDILERARNESRPETFKTAIESPGHGDETLRNVFSHLGSAIKKIDPQITLSEIHNFLRSFHALSFGAGLTLDQAEQAALQKLKRTFGKSDTDAKHILQALQTIAAQMASTSGYANLEILKQKLREMDIRLDKLAAIGASSEEATPLQIAVDAARAFIPEAHGFGNILSLGAIAIDSLRDEIGSIRADLRAGRLEVAEGRLAALRSPARWSLLPAEDKARAIAFEARLSIARTGRFDKATRLLEEAVLAAPDSIDVIRLRLSLISEAEGMEAALNQFPATSDLGLLQLRAAMLLETGRSSEAIDLLDSLERDGETSRLLILYYLVIEDVSAAVEIARASANLDPDYARLTLAIGIAEYNSALIKGASRTLLGGPAPVPQAYVRNDPDARRALAAAKKTFSTLRLKQFESAVSEIVDAFWLATLIVQEKTAEATHALYALLHKSPKALLPLSWALLRNLQFDIDATIRALEACEASADVAALDVLAQCYLRSERGVDAKTLLLRNESVFADAGQSSLYYALLCNVYLDLNQEADAAELIESVSEPLCSQLRLMLLEQASDKTKTFDGLVNQLSENYEKKPSPANLMHLALVLQRAERYTDLGRLSSDLVAVGSSEAKAVALSGLYNSGEFANFVDIVSKSPLGELKPHIRLADAQALDRLGKVQDAADILESQINSTIDVAAVSLLGRLLVRLGDVRRLRRLVAFVLELQTFPPDIALALANSLFFVERVQAVKLWKAYAKDVSDDAVSFTLSLGYRLGLDADPLLEDLTARLVAGAGGAQRYDLEQLREVFSRAAQANEENSEQYERGFLTLHMLAEANRLSVPSLYGAAFDTDVPNAKKPLLLALHGGRSLDQVSLSAKRRLNIDITSLLILDKLSLWNLVCSTFDVRLPYEVFDILQKMLEDLAPNQPSIVAYAEQVINLLDLGQLPDIPFADLSNREPAEIVSLNTVPSDGRLNLEGLQILISSGHAIPERLYFEPGVLHAIDLHTLQKTLRRSKVVVTTEEASRFRSERRARAERSRLFDWVNTVTSKLQDGLDNAFTLLPAIVITDLTIDASSPMVSLMSLLRQSYDNRDAIVIDDRYVSTFLHVEGGTPMVTTFDLLRHLVEKNVISQDAYEAHVLQMLNANGFIWPLDATVLAAALDGWNNGITDGRVD
jgi:tetratricopeptide (TPR) repeat protein